MGEIFGQIHYYSAILALIAGTWVLWHPKGSRQHKKVGLLYVMIMTVMLISSFLTFNLYGHFGLFHWLAMISALTLMAGMLPMWVKSPFKNAILIHLQFMYWSIIGLYMGLFAELFTRIPDTPFLTMVILSSGVVYILGFIGMLLNYKKWYRRFAEKPTIQQS